MRGVPRRLREKRHKTLVSTVLNPEIPTPKSTSGGTPGGAGGFLHRITASLSSAILFAPVSAISFSLAFFITGYVPEDTDTRMIGAMWAMISATLLFPVIPFVSLACAGFWFTACVPLAAQTCLCEGKNGS